MMGVEGEGLWAFLGEWKDFWGVSVMGVERELQRRIYGLLWWENWREMFPSIFYAF